MRQREEIEVGGEIGEGKKKVIRLNVVSEISVVWARKEKGGETEIQGNDRKSGGTYGINRGLTLELGRLSEGRLCLLQASPYSL